MVRLASALFLSALIASTALAGPTRVRSGQVDFSDGIDGDLRVAGDVVSTGTVSADVLSVTGEAVIGDRMEVGDSAHELTIAVAAPSFNAWIESATEASWEFHESNYRASPIRSGVLCRGMLVMGISPGTRLYQVIIHGVFADGESGNELRARAYKQNIATPTNPAPLTTESVETGGASGPFSVTLTPDYVVEEGYATVVVVEIKNANDEKTLFFGVELILHETTY